MSIKIFLKDISHVDIDLFYKYPIHGVIFSITEKNCEYIRAIVEKLPFYMSIIGEIAPMPKYALEEIIFFCKLNGIIIKEDHSKMDLSCLTIAYGGNSDWNAIIKSKDNYRTAKILIDQIDNEAPLIMVFNKDEFLQFWPNILNFWGNRMGNNDSL